MGIRFSEGKLKSRVQELTDCVLCECVLSCALSLSRVRLSATQCIGGATVRGDSPGKNTAVGCHAFLQGMDLPNPGVKPRSPALQVGSLPSEPPKKPPNVETCYLPSSYRQNSDF